LRRQVYSGFPPPSNSLPPVLPGKDQVREKFFLTRLPLPRQEEGWQASSEDLVPLGYGDRESFGSYSLSLDGRGLG